MKSFEEFVRERQYLKNVSPRTIEFYWDCFKSVQKHGDFTEPGLKKWVIGSRSAGVSAASVNTRITGINAYLKWCGESYKVPFLKEEERVVSTYSEPDLKKVLSSKGSGRTRILVLLLLDTGLRIDEALSVRIREVDFDNLVLRIRGKGNKERLVPISLELRKHLFKYCLKRMPEELLFGTKQGKKLLRRNVRRDVKAFLLRCGVTSPPRRLLHSFRHTFAVNYVRQGGSIFHLQRALGHSTLEMTKRYVNLVTEDLVSMQQKVSLLNHR